MYGTPKHSMDHGQAQSLAGFEKQQPWAVSASSVFSESRLSVASATPWPQNLRPQTHFSWEPPNISISRQSGLFPAKLKHRFCFQQFCTTTTDLNTAGAELHWAAETEFGNPKDTPSKIQWLLTQCCMLRSHSNPQAFPQQYSNVHNPLSANNFYKKGVTKSYPCRHTSVTSHSPVADFTAFPWNLFMIHYPQC